MKKPRLLFSLLSIVLITWVTGTANSQNLICSLPDQSSCPGPIIVPVQVQHANNVASISLKMNIDTMALSYTGYQNVNPSLQSGMLLINRSFSQVIISWFSLTPANLGSSNLVELKFIFHVHDSTNILWDDTVNGNCVFTNIDGTTLPATFNNSSITGLFRSPQRAFPADHGTYIDINTELSWYLTGCQAVYDLALSTDSNFINNTVVGFGVAGNTWIPPTLEFLANYYWRIRARNQSDTLPWSDTWRFRTKSPNGISSYQEPEFTASLSPNPCTTSATLHVILPKTIRLEITFTDLFGRVILKFPFEEKNQGEYDFNFPVGLLRPGVYFSILRGSTENKIIQKLIRLEVLH